MYPGLFRFLQGLLNHFVSFSVFFNSFFFTLPLLQIPPLITEVEYISGYPRPFSATFFSMYLTGYVSHCCYVGGYHVSYVYVILLSLMSVANFPPIVAWNVPATSGFLNFSRSTFSLDWVGF